MVVWGIGSEDSIEGLQTYVEQLGLTFPILHDDGAMVKGLYNPGSVPTNSIYPQDWIIGVDGSVRFVATTYEPEEMIGVLEEELAK